MSGRQFEGRAPTLEEALDLAARHKALAVRRKDGLALFTYLWADTELFADPRAREFRGIIYEEATGEVVSRPFHKFFNYREPGLGLGPEAFTVNVLGAPTSPVFLAEKVDGYLLQVVHAHTSPPSPHRAGGVPLAHPQATGGVHGVGAQARLAV
jgi:hypothetical protein